MGVGNNLAAVGIVPSVVRRQPTDDGTKSTDNFYTSWATPLTGLALGIIRILFVLLSKPIADTLFKDE